MSSPPSIVASSDVKTPPPSPVSPSAPLVLSPKLSPLEQEIRNLILTNLALVPQFNTLLQDPLIKAAASGAIDGILVGMDKLLAECEACLVSQCPSMLQCILDFFSCKSCRSSSSKK